MKPKFRDLFRGQFWERAIATYAGGMQRQPGTECRQQACDATRGAVAAPRIWTYGARYHACSTRCCCCCCCCRCCMSIREGQPAHMQLRVTPWQSLCAQFGNDHALRDTKLCRGIYHILFIC